VALTAGLLGVFAVSIPFESATHLLSRAIYATRHTLLQVLSSLGGFAVTIGVTLSLAPRLGVTAIPIGFAAGMGVRVILLSASLAWRLGRWNDAQTLGRTTTNRSSRSG
jgi:peptidoglycan biosynthesis protein MviN/MurJ (putative lipid II flippase)